MNREKIKENEKRKTEAEFVLICHVVRNTKKDMTPKQWNAGARTRIHSSQPARLIPLDQRGGVTQRPVYSWPMYCSVKSLHPNPSL